MDRSESQVRVTPPESVGTPQSSTSVSLHLGLCIKRTGGVYVPLVALDELPTWIKLKGAPRSLQMQEIVDSGIKNLGEYAKARDDWYEVELTSIPSHDHACSTEVEVGSSGSSLSASALSPRSKNFVAPDKKADSPKATSETNNTEVDDIEAKIAGTTTKSEDSPAPLRHQGTPGTLGKKVYCTYWIRTGNCNYMQEGCKYLHEIPPDEETRLAIGVRTFPTWQREDPTLPPQPVKVLQVPTAILRNNWRARHIGHADAELPGTQDTTPRSASSHIAAPVPRSSNPKAGALLQGSNTKQTPALNQDRAFAVQNPTLFSIPQPRFPTYSNNAFQQAPRAQFGDGKSITDFTSPGAGGSFNRLFPVPKPSPTGSVVQGMSVRRASPPTQPPISGPICRTLPCHPTPSITGSCNSPAFSPRPNFTRDYSPISPVNLTGEASPFLYASSATNHNNSQSRAKTPAISIANTATAGNSSNLYNTAQDTQSPPILHRRLFVGEGEPRYVANSVEETPGKPPHKARKTGMGKSKAHAGGKGGRSAKHPSRSEESLIS